MSSSRSCSSIHATGSLAVPQNTQFLFIGKARFLMFRCGWVGLGLGEIYSPFTVALRGPVIITMLPTALIVVQPTYFCTIARPGQFLIPAQIHIFGTKNRVCSVLGNLTIGAYMRTPLIFFSNIGVTLGRDSYPCACGFIHKVTLTVVILSV